MGSPAGETLSSCSRPRRSGQNRLPRKGSWHPASHGSRMTERLSPPQRAILRAFCGFATHLCYLFLCPVASGGLLSRRGESRQRHARGNLFRGGSLWTPSPTTKGAPPPLDSPLLDERRGTGVYEGRETKDEGRGTKNTAGPVGQFDRQAPKYWNHSTLFSRIPNRSPAERVRFGKDVSPEFTSIRACADAKHSGE